MSDPSLQPVRCIGDDHWLHGQSPHFRMRNSLFASILTAAIFVTGCGDPYIAGEVAIGADADSLTPVPGVEVLILTGDVIDQTDLVRDHVNKYVVSGVREQIAITNVDSATATSIITALSSELDSDGLSKEALQLVQKLKAHGIYLLVFNEHDDATLQKQIDLILKERLAARSVTNQEGRFKVSGLANGDYTAYATFTDARGPRIWLVDVEVASRKTTLSLTSQESNFNTIFDAL